MTPSSIHTHLMARYRQAQNLGGVLPVIWVDGEAVNQGSRRPITAPPKLHRFVTTTAKSILPAHILAEIVTNKLPCFPFYLAAG